MDKIKCLKQYASHVAKGLIVLSKKDKKLFIQYLEKELDVDDDKQGCKA